MKYTSIIARLYKVLVFLLTTLLATGSMSAHSFSNARNYNIANGIPENTIRSIIQDGSGYIWLGTKDGISRFNGHTFKNYGGYPKTTEGKPLNVMDLCLHSDGQKIWVASVDGICLFDPQTETFRTFESHSKIRSTVNKLCYDNDGNLWLASSSSLFRYNEKTDTITEYKNDGDRGCLINNVVLSLCKDSSGDIWVGTRNGLSYYHKGMDKFMSYTWKASDKGGDPQEICQILEGKDGHLWIGTHYDGLLRFDRLSGIFTPYKLQDNNNKNTWIRSLFETEDGTLLIGTEDGLLTLDIPSKKVKVVKEFSKAVVYSFMKDHEDGLWLGTYFNGLYYIPPQKNDIRWYCESDDSQSMTGSAVSQFCEDSKGNIWIATEDGGLNYFNTTSREFTHYKTSGSDYKIGHNNIHALMLDGRYLWIGTFSKGIEILDTKSRTVVKRYRFDPNDLTSLSNDHIYSIYKTRSGDIYIGTMKGLCRFNRKTEGFTRLDKFNNIFIYDIIEDDKGTLWIATKNDGVWKYENDKCRKYQPDNKIPGSISSNHIIRAYIDSNENLWFATEGNGLCRYDYERDSFINYDHTKQLYHHIIYGILDDTDGNLWLSTTYGIVRFNPETLQTRIYTQEDGMQSNQFNYRSSLKTSEVTLYFGGINGFNCFNPKSFSTNETTPNTIISEIVLHKKNSEIEIIKPEHKVIITPDVASFDISFDCLSYISPSKNRYAYKVDQLHKDWIYTDKESVSFIDLPAGQYRLYVKSANNDETWSATPVYTDFMVKSPLWETTAAKLTYVLIALLLVALIVKWYIKGNREKQKREKLQMEWELEQESYRSKLQFFTHVAHEIKTPLTLIKAPLDVIIEEGHCDPRTLDNLIVMKQNTDRLLELIKQLLNFRRIDKEGYTLNYSMIEMNEFVSSIVKRFDAAGKSVNMILPTDSFPIYIDAEAVTKILSNLLSNGMKYARSIINVRVEKLEWEGNINVVLSVSDDGPGISESEVNKIFEPFYRSANSSSESGFGIGLSLVKLLVDKLGGSIKAGKSEELGGLSVTVMIPQGKEDAKPIEKPMEKPITIQVDQYQANLLIVEDTKEMLDFLMKNLETKFKVFGAGNGIEALNILNNTAIDIVLSDVMMPEMDGFELLYSIRQDKMLCHIPVVLLSAQGNVNSKIAGLDYGADAYIEKPFSVNHLKATIDNLLKSRKLLFERFTSMPNLDYGKGGMKTVDAEWLEELTNIIKNNLTNEQFTVDTLASEMAVSRSNLRRKVIGVTGLAPNDYIRLVRLKVAAELLQSGKYRVNEVCYLIGFTSHSYFSTCFQKQFGVLPKDYMKS